MSMETVTVVADCGSSKIDWMASYDGEIRSFTCQGMNPAVDSVEILRERMLSVPKALGLRGDERTAVHFYGTGIVSATVAAYVRDVLREVFACAVCTVESDLTGAVRSLFGDDEGLVGILGTGANSALCRDGRPVVNVPSGGYVLGDEGSGAWIGKVLLSDFIKGLMPSDLAKDFAVRYSLNYPTIVENVYRRPSPNRYLASFVPFAHEHLSNLYVRNLVCEGFEMFFSRNLAGYSCLRCYPIRLTGSVAYAFSEMINEVAGAHGACVERIVKSPIEGLLAYHTNKDN